MEILQNMLNLISDDPEAAQIVFSTFPQDRIKLISWDLTKAFQFDSIEDLELFQGNKLRVNIVLSGEKVGMCEVSKDEKNEGATDIITKIDFDMYKDIFLKLIKHH